MTMQSSLFFVIVCFIQLLYSVSLFRDESDNGCFAFVECPPGEEVKPCFESNRFYCAQCLFGYVQPSYVTSNQHDNTCFRPTSSCVGEDITLSRKRHRGFCDSLAGCKCNTNKCFYGDPCLCNTHTQGCPVSTSLSEDGVCQPCAMWTAKNDTGCGPCRAVSPKLYNLHEMGTGIIHTKGPLIPIMKTETNLIKEGKTDTNSRSNPIFMERTLIAIAIGLTFLVLLLVIVLIVLCWRRKQFCFAQGNRRSAITSDESAGANGVETALIMNSATLI